MMIHGVFYFGQAKGESSMALRINRNRLREIRREKGLSAVDIHVLTGIPFSRIYYIERGTYIPTVNQKSVIAKALELPLEKIFPKELEHSQEIITEA